MKIRVFGRSDVGCVRDNNEDMILIGMFPVRDDERGEEQELSSDLRFCTLVSDGMGGHENGEFASEYCLIQLRSFILNKSLSWDSPEEAMQSILADISSELNAKSVESGLSRSMGCTLTGLLFIDGRLYLINVGDSRCYRFRDGLVRQMSVDQTLHERDGIAFPQGKALYSCIGAGSKPSLVLEDISERIMGGDRFLICSDGLTDMISDEEIETGLRYDSPEKSVNALVDTAKAAGGKDNVSVIVVDFIDEPGTEAPADESDTIPMDESADCSEDMGISDETAGSQDSVSADNAGLIERLSKIAEKVIQSRDNALTPHRNIPLVREAFEIFKTLPDYVEGELSPYLKIQYLDRLVDELNEYDAARLTISIREYQLTLFEQVEDQEAGDPGVEDIRSSLQKMKDYIDESISMEDFCRKYHKSLKFDPVERGEKWEEIIYDVYEKAIASCGEPGFMGYCFGLWPAMAAELAAYGIEWKSPQRMNPRVMFD